MSTLAVFQRSGGVATPYMFRGGATFAPGSLEGAVDPSVPYLPLESVAGGAVAATASLTEADDTLAATASTGGGVSATASLTEAADTLAASATSGAAGAVTATLSVTLDPVTLAASATVGGAGVGDTGRRRSRKGGGGARRVIVQQIPAKPEPEPVAPKPRRTRQAPVPAPVWPVPVVGGLFARAVPVTLSEKIGLPETLARIPSLAGSLRADEIRRSVSMLDNAPPFEDDEDDILMLVSALLG